MNDIFAKMRAKAVRDAAEDHANWLDDVIAGLLINGVTKERIRVCQFRGQPNYWEVWIDGVPKYSYQMEFVIGGDKGTAKMTRKNLS
jgi:hypothetical protein